MRVLNTALVFIFIFASTVHAQDADPGGEKLRLNLADSIYLALDKNREIKKAYLQRLTQKYDLEVTEDSYAHQLTISPGVSYDSKYSDNLRTNTTGAAISFAVSRQILTGGSYRFSWDTGADDPDNGDTAYSSSVSASFSQPLLKGAGTEVGSASLTLARIREQENLISLKSQLMNTVTSVIKAYRNLIQAERRLEISARSLERAKDLLRVNQALVKAGRMAKIEIVQSEADIANRELSHISSINSLDGARLALIQILDIDKNTIIDTAEVTKITPPELDVNMLTEATFQNKPDYLTALLRLESETLQNRVAKNSRLWDLSLDASATRNISDTGMDKVTSGATELDKSDYRAGLKLTVPIGATATHQEFVRSQVSLRSTRIDLEELRENIEIEIKDKVRDVNMKLKQVELARLSRNLSERKLMVEKEKLKSGRSTNFQIVSFENDLVNAQNGELDAVINFKNALSDLDQAAGTTLDTWKIEIRDEKETAGSILRKLED